VKPVVSFIYSFIVALDLEILNLILLAGPLGVPNLHSKTLVPHILTSTKKIKDTIENPP